MMHRMIISKWSIAARTAVIIFVFTASSCSRDEAATEYVWALNVDGEAYEGVDGTRYTADDSVSGGISGTVALVKGTQDEALYANHRQGDIRISHKIDSGVYDVTFHFAEPDNIAGGERVFNVIAEDRRVISNLDVMAFRDGQVHSALTVTAPDIEVTDGVLDIRFEALAGEPLLSALVVRGKVRTEKEWQLVWNDEFDVDGAPDSRNWTIQEWPRGVVNSEDQAYTPRTRNLRVENGALVIEAHKEKFDEAEYTSGRLHSSGKQDFLYGRFEARAKAPKGQGTWAAIWMLPSNPFTYATTCADDEDWQGSKECDAWPNSGEIDILEHVGYLYGHIHGTVHNRAYYFKNWQQRKGRIVLDDVTDEYHVYAMEWSPERIDVYVDDTLYFTNVNERNGWRTWPFDQPFHIIMNLAIGGDWGRAGGPIDDSVFPQRMFVDYVRVYQRKAE